MVRTSQSTTKLQRYSLARARLAVSVHSQRNAGVNSAGNAFCHAGKNAAGNYFLAGISLLISQVFIL